MLSDIINKINMKHLKKFCIYFIAIFTIAVVGSVSKSVSGQAPSDSSDMQI